jgi:hypothetical protein
VTDSIRRTHRFAYVEFAEPDFIDPALALDNSLFHGRLIKVGLDRCVHMTELVLSLFCFARLWRRGPMYQDLIEDGEGGEAVTEAVTEVVSEAEEEDSVPTGALVAGMSLQVVIRVLADRT